MSSLLAMPEGLTATEDDICSNADHTINADVATLLKEGKHFSEYPGWNFFAKVWFASGQYHAEVWRYNRHVDTVSGETFRDVKGDICAEYGND